MVDKSFWSFFVNLYNAESIESACACLQSKYGININILFFCCWAAEQHYAPLSIDYLKSLQTKVTTWHNNILNPLKALHKKFTGRTLNKPCTELYRQLVSHIIYAEQIEQSLILQTMDQLKKTNTPDENPSNPALSNIFNYLKSENLQLHKNDLEKIYRIVQRCFA